MEEKFLLKDQLFNREKVKQIAAEIKSVYSEFEDKKFVKITVDKFPELELSGRLRWISECLKEYLPSDYKTAVNILIKSLPPKNEFEFGDFIYAPYSDFVAKGGLNKDDLRFSLDALKKFTIYFSAEESIRYFINTFPDQSLVEILKWSQDSDFRVRRLASEGTRPKLPWAPKINTGVEYALPILDNLFSDKDRFVTRSVANHLNDISKISPKIVLDKLTKWKISKKQNTREMDYIISHALRTLIKKGDENTIKFLNYSIQPEVKISNFKLNHPVKFGNSLEFSFEITAKKDERLLIDYILHFQNKAGNGQNKKVFKLKIINIKKDQKINITKRQFMKDLSTRKHYLGKHKIEIQINGQKMIAKEFNLVASRI